MSPVNSRTTVRRVVGLVAVGALAVLPLVATPYRVFQLNQTLVYAIALAGLVVLIGRTGQVSVAHSAFFAVGAYATAALMVHADWPFVPALVAAAALSWVAGGVAGLPALRVSGLYLVLVTMALAVAAPIIIKRLEPVTGGASGIQVEQVAAPAWSGLADDQWSFYVAAIVAMVMFWLASNVLKGRPGRALTAVRDRELAAKSLGINPGLVKVQAFALSAMFAGVAGGLYVHTVGFISPGSVTVFFAITLLTGAVIGGARSLLGAVLGAAFIQYAPVLTSDVSDALGGLVYGATLILAMLTVPGGLVEIASLIAGRMRRRSAVPPSRNPHPHSEAVRLTSGEVGT
jgi:branched-chain amino acid transport system permease protein